MGAPKTRKKYFLIISVVAISLICCVFFLTRIIPLNSGLSEYVNTLSGTGNGPNNYSHGHVHPLTTLPNGFTMWAPMTKVRDSANFYRYADSTIQGFTATHIPHRWIGTYSSFFFMPEAGELITDPDSRAIEFDHGNEIAKPHYYSVVLKNGIRTEISPAMRAAFVKMRFPAGDAHILFDGLTSVTVNQSENTVTGYVDQKAPRLYFYAVVDKEIISFGYPVKGSANIDFSTERDEVVSMRIGTSYFSVDQARINLQGEIGVKSFSQVKKEAEDIWNTVLSKIEIKGATEDQKVTFYSNLYRTKIYPNVFWENVEGEIRHKNPYGGEFSGKLYVNNGFWDTYKSAWPLYGLLEPVLTGDMLDGFVNFYRESGFVPQWSHPVDYDYTPGTHSDVLFADAYIKGIRNFDFNKAYESMLFNACQPTSRRKINDRSLFIGYVPDNLQGASGSWTLEDAMCDAAIARMAKAMGKEDDYEYFRNKSLSYSNIFSTSVGGFFRGKNLDGTWRTSDTDFRPNEWGYDFMEGAPWQYRFSPAFDAQGLANLFGGRSKLTEKLDEMFINSGDFLDGMYGFTIHEMQETFDAGMGQYSHPNEHDHYTPYLYNYTGVPASTAFRIRDILTRLYSSGTGTGGGFIGDDDNGGMSGWYIWGAIGIMPAPGATSEYLIGSPLFSNAVIHLSSGKKFEVIASNNSEVNIYVQSAILNGKDYSKNYLNHSDIVNGGTLVLNMGPSPQSAWGTGEEDLPTSMTSGSEMPYPAMDVTRSAKAKCSGGTDIVSAVDDYALSMWSVSSSTCWIQFQLSGPENVRMYTITSSDDSANDPKNWVLKGSKDGDTWIVIDKRENESFLWKYHTRSFSVGSTELFNFFRLEISENNGGGKIALGELELLGK